MLRRFVDANRRHCNWLEKRFPRFFGFSSYQAELLHRIEEDLKSGCDSVLEVGGIDRPMLSRGGGFRYDGLDIEERPRCHEIYDDFHVQSIESAVPGTYGMIVSLTLLEHVPDNAASAKSMLDALQPNGTTHHYVPNMGHPYALILRLVGPRLQQRLLALLRTEGAASVSGYPTFFDHCTVGGMTRLFDAAGFCDVDTTVYYRANGYFEFFSPLFVLVTAFENVCRSLGWNYFSSGFVISARKPGQGRTTP